MTTRVRGEGRDGRGRHDENQGKTGKKHIQCDLVRGLLPFGAFDQRDHPVDEGGTSRGRDAHLDPVGQHLSAAGNGRTVATGFTDHRGGFAGDCSLVDRGHTFDHLTVRGDDVARLDQNNIADLQTFTRHIAPLGSIRTCQKLCTGVRSGLPERRGLCLPAAFGDSFRKVRKQKREPQPQNDLERKAESLCSGHQVLQKENGTKHRDHGHDEHDRVLCKHPWIEFFKGTAKSGPKNAGVEHARWFRLAHQRLQYWFFLITRRGRLVQARQAQGSKDNQQQYATNKDCAEDQIGPR